MEEKTMPTNPTPVEARPSVSGPSVLQNKTRLLTAVLALVFVLSIVQAVQLGAISSELNQQQAKLVELESSAEAIAGADFSTAGGSSSAASGLPTNLTNLPNMVGGC